MKGKVFVSLFLGASLLVGCGNPSLKVTKDDVLEVAQDDANVEKKDCSDVSVKKGVDYYTVKFTTDKGSYSYKIGLDGIIQSRSYGKSVSGKTTKETKKTTETKTSSGFDDKQQAAINAVLGNMALAQSDVSDIQCTLSEDGSQYTVSMSNNGTPIQAVVDANTNEVISTNVGQ
jgi:hypothetical protein